MLPNEVDKTKVWTDNRNISSKHYFNKCYVHEKQNMHSKWEKCLVLR